MNWKALILFLLPVVITACSPSHADYEASQKELATLRANERALTQQVQELRASLQTKTNELVELKQTPAALLAGAKNAKTDEEKISKLQLLISRYPEAEQENEAQKLLSATKTAIASSKLAEAIERNAKNACIVPDKRLPSNFIGTNISSVISGFKKLKSKGEFEPTSAYKARIKEDVLAVANPVQCVAVDTTYDTKYDADRKGWVIGIYPKEGDYPHKSYRFILSNKTISSSSYVGSNAFGVTKSIDKSAHVSEGVTFSSSSFLRYMRSSGAKSDSIFYKWFIPMSVQDAKAIKVKDLKVLIRYKWEPDYLEEDFDRHSPTINDPTETSTKILLLHGEILEAIVFDKESGDILARK